MCYSREGREFIPTSLSPVGASLVGVPPLCPKNGSTARVRRSALCTPSPLIQLANPPEANVHPVPEFSVSTRSDVNSRDPSPHPMARIDGVRGSRGTSRRWCGSEVSHHFGSHTGRGDHGRHVCYSREGGGVSPSGTALPIIPPPIIIIPPPIIPPEYRPPHGSPHPFVPQRRESIPIPVKAFGNRPPPSLHPPTLSFPRDLVRDPLPPIHPSLLSPRRGGSANRSSTALQPPHPSFPWNLHPFSPPPSP